MAALKIAKPGSSLAVEAEIVARIARRWGPGLLDAGAGWVATEWTEGRALAPIDVKPADRERV